MKKILTAAALGILVVAAPGAAQQVRFDDVIRNLRNPDPRARMSALSLLRDSKYLEAIEPIAPLVNDPDTAIQLVAIETELSFYLVDDVNARRRVALIIEVRNSGRGETAFAAGPLAVWPHPVPAALISSLLKAVDDEDAKVRIEAIYTLGAVARPPVGDEHAQQLIKALDHYDPAVRAAAARVIGRLQVRGAGEALIKAVNDSQQPVRFAAMRALGEIREASAIQALVQQLEYYRKGEGAWSALDALAHIGHASSVPVFKARLADRDQYMRRAAIEGLARAGDLSEIATFETLAGTDTSDVVRAAAAFALQVLGRDSVARMVQSLGSDRMAPQVAGYFIELGQPAASALVPHLKDPGESVRGNVALILGAIGTQADIPLLEPLLQDRSADVRRAAERAIRRLKVRGA